MVDKRYDLLSAFQRRRERGRIATDSIHTVEQAQLAELSKQIPDGVAENSQYKYPFQVGYTEQNTDYTLYLIVGDHSERLHWIHTIRSLCVCNTRRPRYHPGAWSARRWACCDGERRSAPGCQIATIWPLPEPQLEILVQKEKPVNDVTRKCPH
ncbi:unnamed protein product [Diatraea saccharalis]|uniref:PH domain-containing protein n=1 Tax=Diatraea saccharalis TaxID=40085 RepID=A0A9N9R937_9NEOP|nr:unnamed protein product [Diatraea saccharalis]